MTIRICSLIQMIQMLALNGDVAVELHCCLFTTVLLVYNSRGVKLAKRKGALGSFFYLRLRFSVMRFRTMRLRAFPGLRI